MLNFQAVHDKKITLTELVAGLTRDDPSASSGQALRELTDEMMVEIGKLCGRRARLHEL